MKNEVFVQHTEKLRLKLRLKIKKIAFPGRNYRCVKTNLSMMHYKTYNLNVYETCKFSGNLILALFVTKMKRT